MGVAPPTPTMNKCQQVSSPVGLGLNSLGPIVNSLVYMYLLDLCICYYCISLLHSLAVGYSNELSALWKAPFSNGQNSQRIDHLKQKKCCFSIYNNAVDRRGRT